MASPALPSAADAAIAAACLDAGLPAPDFIRCPPGERPERRFSVYRNNVVASLIGALEAKYPAVAAIVGDEFFRAAARLFIAAHPPRGPVMAQFGGAFADFLAAFPPASGLPYLADVARLEALVLEAFHAADAAPLTVQHLPALASGTLALRRHPAAFVLRAQWPALTLWRMNTGRAALGAVDDWSGEDVLVARPGLEVAAVLLPPGGAVFLDALAHGPAAAATAALAEPGADLSLILTALAQAGAFAAPEAQP